MPERDRESVSVLDAWAWAENDPWEIAVEADGLGALVWRNRFDLFGLLVSERRNNGPNWRNGAWSKLIRMRATNRVPLPVLRRIGVPVPEGARVRRFAPGRHVSLPASVAVTDSFLWLLGLWVAEGSWHRSPGNAFLTIACDDERLDRAERIVRDELGLHVVRAKATPARAASLFVHSGLLLRVLDHLGFADGAKCIPGWILGLPLSRLKWFLEGYREGDGVHSGAKLEAAVRHEFSTTSDRLKDDLVVAFARFGLVPSVGRYENALASVGGDRRDPFWRLTLARVAPWSPLEWDSGVEQRLNARTTGDLVWAKVTAVREVPSTPMVYDFSVPGYENFWAGTGVMAHNTYGPKMRPNDGRAIPNFISQALAEKPLTVYGEGSQTRSFCYVDDLIRGLILLAESGEHLPVNIGNPGEYTILELAEAVLAATGSASQVIYEALPVDDPQVRQPDITRARRSSGGSRRSSSTRGCVAPWRRSGGTRHVHRTGAVVAALVVAVACFPRSERVRVAVAASRHLRRRGRAVRRTRSRLPAAAEDGDAAPARQPLVVGAGDQRCDAQAEAPRRPDRSRVQLGHLRPDGALLDRQRHPADLLHHRDAAAGPMLRRGGTSHPRTRATSRTSRPRRRSATAGRSSTRTVSCFPA